MWGKKKDKTIELISDRLHNICNDLSSDIYLSIQTEREKANVKGAHNGGLFVAFLEDIIKNKIINSCKEFLQYISDIQAELNIVYSEKQLEKIETCVRESYQSLSKNLLNKFICESLNQFSGMESQFELWDNSLKSNIENVVNVRIKEIRLKNQLRKDNKAITESRKANLIATIAAVVSIISIVITNYKKIKIKNLVHKIKSRNALIFTS